MTNVMKIVVDLERNDTVEVQVEEGKIVSLVTYTGMGSVFGEEIYYKSRFERIFNENIEAFKNILINIKEDEEFFPYGKSLLDAKREQARKELLDCMKGYEAMLLMLAEKQKEVDRYTL